MLRAKQAAIAQGGKILPVGRSPAPRIAAFMSQTPGSDRLQHPSETERRRMTMDEPASPKQPTKSDGRTKGQLTRSQVAARLGVSISKIRTMERKALHPTKIDG